MTPYGRFLWAMMGRWPILRGRYPAVRCAGVLAWLEYLGQGEGAEARRSILSLGWEPGPEGTGAVTLVLAGDGAVRVEGEALEVTLQDVTKPYIAPSRKKPEHRD